MKNSALFSSGKDDWETPQSFYNALNDEFHFTLDACAVRETAKCDRYFSPDDNGLSQDWTGETVYCNPPYSRGSQSKWIEKCYTEGQKPNTTVVMLIPSRTDTIAFHRYIYGKAEIRFVKGRLKFGGAKSGAPFPSMVVVFKGRNERKEQNETKTT